MRLWLRVAVMLAVMCLCVSPSLQLPSEKYAKIKRALRSITILKESEVDDLDGESPNSVEDYDDKNDGKPVNVAYGKPVQLSSVSDNSPPPEVVTDGVIENSDDACAQPGASVNQYISIDLGRSFLTHVVHLWVKEKDDVMKGKYKFLVRVGDYKAPEKNVICGYGSSGGAFHKIITCPKPVCGRYVSVSITDAVDDDVPLKLCEIRAFTSDSDYVCDARKDLATCYCHGDPHCRQFDHLNMVNVQGACRYTMARDGCEDGVPVSDASWRVLINNDRFIPKLPVTHVKKVTVLLQSYHLKIELHPKMKTLINGVRLTAVSHSFDNGVVVVYKTNQYVHVMVRDGIQVMWDGDNYVIVHVPDTLAGQTCGLCGNYNGATDDDWILGPSEICMGKYPGTSKGQKTDNVNILTTSWTYASDTQDPACMAECPQPPQDVSCDSVDYAKAVQNCNILSDENGPFGDCVRQMDAKQVAERYQACVFDSCHTGKSNICEHARTLSHECILSTHIIINYRSSTFCPLRCSEGMEYLACGNPCQSSCNDLQAESCQQFAACEEGCFCMKGYVYNGHGKCIKAEECGCYDETSNLYLDVGEEKMAETCDKICRCEAPQGSITCSSNVCPGKKECRVVDGDYGCFCPPQMKEIQDECTDLENPCTGSETEVLQCFTCNDVRSDEECYRVGSMETCHNEEPICHLSRIYNVTDMSLTRVDRGCYSRYHCVPESVGEDARFCSPGEDLTVQCQSCNFGAILPIEDQEEVYRCHEPETSSRCRQPKATGDCLNFVTRWYFDTASCRCREFEYGGCDGNDNNYASFNECAQTCGNIMARDVCLLDQDPGTCDLDTIRYSYNVTSKTCESFQYGGCDGNGNRFETMDGCMNACNTC